MTKENEFQVDRSWKGVYKVGGVCLFAAGVVPFFFILLITVLQQTWPVPAQEALANPMGPTILSILAAVGELLLMLGGIALYLSLKDVGRTPMLVAASLWLLATPMFLLSRALIVAISQVSGSYLAATSEATQAAYLAAAELAIETQSMFAYIGLILLSAASIIIGWVMLKGVYGKVTGTLAIAAGILTLFTPLGVIIAVPFAISFLGILLSATWQIMGGLKLYRLGAALSRESVPQEGAGELEQQAEPKFEH